MAVDLVGLDEVGEHEAAVELVDQLGRGRRSPPALVGALVLVVDADAVEHLADLADGVHRHAGGLQLLQVGAPGRRRARGPCGPSVRSNAPGSPRNGRAITRPTACSPDMISRAAAQAAYSSAGGHLVDVRGDLQHRVGRRVDDQVAGREVLLAEVVDHRGAAVGPVAEDAAAGGVDQLRR